MFSDDEGEPKKSKAQLSRVVDKTGTVEGSDNFGWKATLFSSIYTLVEVCQSGVNKQICGH